MDFLLTGATGFIGQHVLTELLSAGYRVLALSRKAMNFQANGFRNVVFDFHKDNIKELKDLPMNVIHLAWSGLPNYKEKFHLTENLPAQKRFIQHLVAEGCDNITITGTCMEYGLQSGMLSEDMPVHPDTPYAKAKVELQNFVFGLQRPNTMKWVRLFYMYGDGQSPKSIIPLLHKAVKSGEETFNMSGGEQVRDYLPIEKVAKNVVDIAVQNKITGIINCGSGQPQKLKNFIESYKLRNNIDIALNLGFYPYPDYEPMEFWGDIRKLKKVQDNDTEREV